MKISGYNQRDMDQPDFQFGENLVEVTLEASPHELRLIAEFLNEAADKMDSFGAQYSHEHLADSKPEFKRSPHFVVFNSDLTAD